MLAAWYPLINDMHNQGVGDADLTVSSTPTFSTGLIGGALSSGGAAAWTAEQSAKILNNTALSIAFWIYPNVDTGSSGAIIFGTNNMTPPNNRKFSIFQYPTCNDLHLSWQNDTSSTFVGGAWSGVLPSRTWTHVCVTYQNPSVKIYINGSLYATTSGVSNSASFEYSTQVIAANANRKICDFRVYDNCISAKEVAEIAKGIIIHYPLNSSMPNLAKGTNTDSTSTNTFIFSEATGGSTRSIEYDGSVPCAKITRNSTTHASWAYLHYDNWDRAAIKTNTWYTLSMDIIASGSGTIGLSAFMNGNATNSITDTVETIQNSFNSTNWSHLVFHIHTISSFDDKGTGQCIYMSCGYLNNVEVWVKMKNLKLEEGKQETHWIPHTSDVGYSVMGLGDNIEYDVSGHNYHGTKTNISYESDSPRNTTSTKVTTTSGIFGRPSIALDKFTIAFWGKHSAANKMLMGSCPNVSTNNTSWYWYGDNSFKYPSGEFYYEHNAGTYTLNTWMHFAVTYDGTNIRVYRNGVAEGSKAASGTMTLDYLSVGRGYGSNYAENGNVSDFRLYATVLTADQIKELYNAPVSLTNNSTLLTQGEFIET